MLQWKASEVDLIELFKAEESHIEKNAMYGLKRTIINNVQIFILFKALFMDIFNIFYNHGLSAHPI